ncbi:MAG: type II toxin-antitoxin system PemK/MazF family toxin [Desulfobacteraceae bacterium]|nr:type II toxin-antitoxin system PemK/MazF family toxin [Desulfobacteraceae bacterium]
MSGWKARVNYRRKGTWRSAPSRFHVPIAKGCKLTGFVMVEQVKSVDFRARRARRIENGNDTLLAEVLAVLDAIVY